MWGLGCLIWETFNGDLPRTSSLKVIGKVSSCEWFNMKNNNLCGVGCLYAVTKLIEAVTFILLKRTTRLEIIFLNFDFQDFCSGKSTP